MVAPREALLANSASVRLDAKVRPSMARELIRTRETPLTVWPVANVRLLT